MKPSLLIAAFVVALTGCSQKPSEEQIAKYTLLCDENKRQIMEIALYPYSEEGFGRMIERYKASENPEDKITPFQEKAGRALYAKRDLWADLPEIRLPLEQVREQYALKRQRTDKIWATIGRKICIDAGVRG